MKKTIFILAIIVTLLILSLTFILANSNVNNKKDFNYSRTKAICSGNSCQDFLINCSASGEVIEMTPLTGRVVFSGKWKDLRTNEEKRLCSALR